MEAAVAATALRVARVAVTLTLETTVYRVDTVGVVAEGAREVVGFFVNGVD